MKKIVLGLGVLVLFGGCMFTDSAMSIHKTAQETVRMQTVAEKELKIEALKYCSKLPQEMVSIKNGVTTVYKQTTFGECMASVAKDFYHYQPNQPKDILESTSNFFSGAGGTILGGLGIWANWDTSRRGQKYSYKNQELQTAYQQSVMSGMFKTVQNPPVVTPQVASPLIVKPEIITPQVIKPEIIEKTPLIIEQKK